MALKRKTYLKPISFKKATFTSFKKTTPLKKTGMIKQKPPDPKYIADRHIQQQKDLEFYRKIWNEREHVCGACGVFLPGDGFEINKGYFDHILEKSTHKDLRYEPDNIILVCLDCHGCKTNGFPKPKHKEAIDRAIKQFLTDGEE